VRPSWDSGHTNSARRLLRHIETVFDYAKAKGWRTGDNPAAWGVFQHILQAQGPSGPKPHYPALKWPETLAFMARLRDNEPTMPALALEMMVLTACRSGEVRGMLWTEIDFETGTWTVPAEQMKRKLPHEVPLSADAVALLRRPEAARINKFVFPGRRGNGPVTNYPVWALVQRLTGRADNEASMASVHGFRASFRSWCRAKRVADDVAERALARGREDATQAAYDSEEMLEDRRKVMERWASFSVARTPTTSCRSRRRHDPHRDHPSRLGRCRRHLASHATRPLCRADLSRRLHRSQDQPPSRLLQARFRLLHALDRLRLQDYELGSDPQVLVAPRHSWAMAEDPRSCAKRPPSLPEAHSVKSVGHPALKVLDFRGRNSDHRDW